MPSASAIYTQPRSWWLQRTRPVQRFTPSNTSNCNKQWTSPHMLANGDQSREHYARSSQTRTSRARLCCAYISMMRLSRSASTLRPGSRYNDSDEIRSRPCGGKFLRARRRAFDYARNRKCVVLVRFGWGAKIILSRGQTLLDGEEDTGSLASAHHAHDVISGRKLLSIHRLVEVRFGFPLEQDHRGR